MCVLKVWGVRDWPGLIFQAKRIRLFSCISCCSGIFCDVGGRLFCLFLLLLLLLCVSVSRLLLMRTISLFFTACFCVAFILTSSHSLSPSFPSIGPRNVSSTEVHPCFKCTLPHPLHRQGERPQAVFREYSTVPLLSREAEKHSAHLTDSDF